MDEMMISFITAINNEGYYNQCLSHIEKLEITLGYSIEKIEIRGEKSLCKAYNIGMNKAKGKYKIYIHQDAGIVNQYFIRDILEIFKNKSVGLIGMVGTASLDSSAIWWNVQLHCVGMVKHFSGIDPIFRNPVDLFEDVVAVDGLLIATQYDIPWREDVLDGFHFYDISQCMEFYKANLRVVIPRQDNIWVRHGFDGRAGNYNGYERNRLIFTAEYEKIYIRTATKPIDSKFEEKTLKVEAPTINSDVKLYVIANLNNSLLKSESIYPIAPNKTVGESLNIISSDTLDNIGCDSNTFGDLTSFYWAWKNDISTQYIGFFNSNRYLILNENPNVTNGVYSYGWDSTTVNSIFTQYDIIVPKPLTFEMTVYEQYNICHRDGLLDKLMEVIRTKYPWVEEAFNIALKKKSGYYNNLFVMRKTDFNNYMEFAFNVFAEVKGKLDAPLENKAFSFLGERLFSLYVEYLKRTHNFRVKEVDIYSF